MPRPRTDIVLNPARRVRDRAGSPGYYTRADAQGLEFHCPVCDAVVKHPWEAIDQEQAQMPDDVSTVRLPACECGCVVFLSSNDEDYEPGSQDDLMQTVTQTEVVPRLSTNVARCKTKV